jgi:hypothetical protein
LAHEVEAAQGGGARHCYLAPAMHNRTTFPDAIQPEHHDDVGCGGCREAANIKAQ